MKKSSKSRSMMKNVHNF